MLFCRSRSHKKGFSLIEMMWQLVILVVVSFPMVMALNIQKQAIEKDETRTRDQVLTNSLFAVVNPQDADWFHQYTVTSSGPYVLSANSSTGWTLPTETSKRHRTSIYCDAANPSLASGQCTESESYKGDNVTRPPFFERELNVVDNKLRVTVRLFKKAKKADDATPFYESSRDFDMVPYRIMVSRDALGTTNLRTPQPDEVGRFWFPDVGYRQGQSWDDVSTDPDDTDPFFTSASTADKWSMVRQNACRGGIINVSNGGPPVPASLAAPYAAPMSYGGTKTLSYWTLTQYRNGPCPDSFANWLSYRFRVPPGTYNINLYFLIPQDSDIDTDCIAGTTNMSCSLADIAISSGNAGTITAANTYLNFDVNAAAGPVFNSSGVLQTTSDVTKPAVFRTRFTPTGNEIRVFIKPTLPTSTGAVHNTLYFSGIEVVRS